MAWSLKGEYQLGAYREETVEVSAQLIIDLMDIFYTCNLRAVLDEVSDIHPAQLIAIWRNIHAAREKLEARHGERFNHRTYSCD